MRNPYLICELANVHGGNIKHMYKLIDQFNEVQYSSKGIKFQIFKYDCISLSDFEWYQVYQELFFDKNEWKEFIDYAGQYGDVWIDIFDLYGVEILRANLKKVKGIKLQASVLGNDEVFAALNSLNLSCSDFELIVNVSGFDVDEISVLASRFRKISTRLILQVGYQSYPTIVSDTGLQKIGILKAAFPDLTLCLADHSDATSDFALMAPIYGFLLGCDYIEKHMCISQESSKYDKCSALDLDQFNKLSQNIDDAISANTGLFLSTTEKQYLSSTVQTPVVRHGLKHGDLIGQGDVIYRRTSQAGLDFTRIQEQQRNGYVLNKNKSKMKTVLLSDYRKAKVAAVVACRMKSSRLPQKAILPIAGIPSVERCLSQCLSFPDVDDVILATSDLTSDDELRGYDLDGKVQVWRGDPDDVIARYVGACDKYNVDVVVRVTADCPLVSPEIIDFLLQRHFESGADYTAAKHFAVGTSGEIINVNALRKVLDYFGSAVHSEYMTWYFQNNKETFKINMVDLPEEYVKDYRMTLDYKEDLEFFDALYSKLNGESAVYSLKDVFRVLDEHPEIADINSHLTLTYRVDTDLIELLDKETKMQVG